LPDRFSDETPCPCTGRTLDRFRIFYRFHIKGGSVRPELDAVSDDNTVRTALQMAGDADLTAREWEHPACAAFVIVTNTTGTFSGLPEGAVVTVPDSLARFHITYLGGKS